MSPERPVLALADLERFDPSAPPAARGERRMCCPLPPCNTKPTTREHRSLSLNVDTGAWQCFRCGASGLLAERWPSRPLDRGARARASTARAFQLGAAQPRPPAATAEDWRAAWDATGDLLDTPGARYLAGRGLSLRLPLTAGVRWAPRWAGRPAVVFPIVDRTGAVVAAQGRYVDGRDDPKARTLGPKSLGLFVTTNAMNAEQLVITEAPIDALSLAVVDVPAVALIGTTGPAWLPQLAAFRNVALAFDADPAGDHAAEQLARQLAPIGARLSRWRPEGAKDWNELLVRHGPEALRAALTSP